MFGSFVPLPGALEVKNRPWEVIATSSAPQLAQTWFPSSPAAEEWCDLGHRGLGKCQDEEGHSQKTGSRRGLGGLGTVRAQWDGQPLGPVPSHRAVVNSIGSFWSFEVKTGGAKPHSHSCSLEVAPQRVRGGEAGRGVRWLGAPQSRGPGFEPSTLAAQSYAF